MLEETKVREECLYCHNNGIHDACPVCGAWKAEPERTRKAYFPMEEFDPDDFVPAYP